MRETWFFLLTHIKNYRSANILVCKQFISDPLPWKRIGVGRVGGMKGKVSRKSRVAKVRAAEDQGGKPLGSLRPGGQRPSGLRAKSVKSAKSAPSPQERASPLF